MAYAEDYDYDTSGARYKAPNRRVLAAGDRTRVTVTSAKATPPGRDRSPPYKPRPHINVYNRRAHDYVFDDDVANLERSRTGGKTFYPRRARSRSPIPARRPSPRRSSGRLRPTYPKVARKFVTEETLELFNVPWEPDAYDSDYIIILREMNDAEVQVLFEHTHGLRRERNEALPDDEESMIEVVSKPAPATRRSGTIEVIEAPSRTQSRSRSRLRRSRSQSRHDIQEPLRHETRDDYDAGLASEDDNNSVLDFDYGFLQSLAIHREVDDPSVSSWETSTASPDAENHKTSARGPVDELNVVQSKWLGNTFDEWELGSELTTVSSPPIKASRPVIRWQHLERPLINFAEFLTTACRSLQVPASDRRHVEELLRKIQKDHEKQRQHGREMEPLCMAEVDLKGEGDNKKQTASVCFFSMPLFALETHNGNALRSLTAGSAEHPVRPMLQAHTRTVNDKRELSQAVTTVSTTPRGHCLHVATLWCLLVNNDTLITCSKLPLRELRQDVVALVQGLPRGGEEHIRVTAGRLRAWDVPRQRVPTWSTLISLFTDELSDLVGHHPLAVFKQRDRLADSKTWMDNSSRVSAPVVEFRIENAGYTSSAAQRQRIKEVRDKIITESTRPKDDIAEAKQDDHAGSAMPKDLDPLATTDDLLKLFFRSNNCAEKDMIRLADAFDKAASGGQLGLDVASESYKTSFQATRQDIQAWLTKINSEAGEKQYKAASKRGQSLMQHKTVIALLTEYIFAFFWPIDLDHAMARKFWGALKKILDRNTFYLKGDADRHRNKDAAVDFYISLYEKIFLLTHALTSALANSKNPLQNLPEDFHMAWMYIMSAFVIAAEANVGDATTHRGTIPTRMLSRAHDALKAGERKLTIQLRQGLDIEDLEVCPSRGIAALILDRVSRDVMHGSPDVAQTYGDYCQQLEAKLMTDPFSRSHQETLRAVLQEIDAVSTILAQQLDIVNVYESSIQELDTNTPTTLPVLRSSRLDTVLRRTKDHINSRIDQFQALQARIEELGEWHLGQIDTNKDRQESAIMVFTIVTIVFLPMSFVSGVLGMNTNDVRNMSLNQWVYWAAALPLTVVVVGVSLWWAGMFDDVWGWVARRSSGGGTSGGGGYVQVASDETGRLRSRLEPMSLRTERVAGGGYAAASGPRKRTTYPIKRAHVGEEYRRGYA